MKIKTITCHDVYNVGASLQAYGLAMYLEQLGHDVEIIDYKPDYLSGHHRLWGGVNSKYRKPVLKELYCIAKLPERLRSRLGKRKKEFDKFTKNNLPLTRRYCSFEELKLDPPQAEVYFAGSDQIWNTLFKNGKDPAFYLQFGLQDSIWASYAASFSTDTIADDWKTPLSEWLSELDYISVREKTGIDILQSLGITNGQQVLDPVFLLDEKEWTALAEKWENPISDPYVLVYDFDNNKEMADFALQIAQKNNWKVVSILKNLYIPKNFTEEGPNAFLSLIQNASLVVSNSFHATAFSLIFKKNFYVFKRREGINTRMVDLLDLVGLKERLVEEIWNICNKEIDYETVNVKLQIEINNSKTFIDQVLLGAIK